MILYNCKYPGKLNNRQGYAKNIFFEYKKEKQYASLAEKASKEFLLYFLRNIQSIIEAPIDNLQVLRKRLSFLEIITTLSEEEFWDKTSPEESLEEYFSDIYLILYNPEGAIDYLSKSMDLSLEGVSEAVYVAFIKEAAIHCLKEVVLLNLKAIEVLIKEEQKGPLKKNKSVRFC